MPTRERMDLVAACGIDCGICELYVCRDNPQLRSLLVSKGIPEDRLPCDGCRAEQGGCPVIGESCATYACTAERNVDYCFECEDFPCEKLHPAANRAEVLPHNMKLYNLCTIKRRGVAKFLEQAVESKRRYYAGTMAIGRGPQLAVATPPKPADEAK